jgi:hypothetical protein
MWCDAIRHVSLHQYLCTSLASTSGPRAEARSKPCRLPWGRPAGIRCLLATVHARHAAGDHRQCIHPRQLVTRLIRSHILQGIQGGQPMVAPTSTAPTGGPQAVEVPAFPPLAADATPHRTTSGALPKAPPLLTAGWQCTNAAVRATLPRLRLCATQ